MCTCAMDSLPVGFPAGVKDLSPQWDQLMPALGGRVEGVWMGNPERVPVLQQEGVMNLWKRGQGCCSG